MDFNEHLNFEPIKKNYIGKAYNPYYTKENWKIEHDIRTKNNSVWQLNVNFHSQFSNSEDRFTTKFMSCGKTIRHKFADEHCKSTKIWRFIADKNHLENKKNTQKMLKSLNLDDD